MGKQIRITSCFSAYSSLKASPPTRYLERATQRAEFQLYWTRYLERVSLNSTTSALIKGGHSTHGDMGNKRFSLNSRLPPGTLLGWKAITAWKGYYFFKTRQTWQTMRHDRLQRESQAFGK